MSAALSPVVFVGHGNPMNALADNAWTRAWRQLSHELPRPRAVLAISAHWYIEGLAVTAMGRPRTIHDFGGFPRELSEVRYPAPGDPSLARRVAELLAPRPVALDTSDWGLDHGTWSVLTHVFPQADVPVVQLSVDAMAPASVHHEIGRALSPLREEGILILGSGNVVHNLRAFRWRSGEEPSYPWASRFEDFVRKCLLAGDHAPLIAYEEHPDSRLAIPTPDHYLPLLPVLGAGGSSRAAILCDGIDGASVSMLSVRLG